MKSSRFRPNIHTLEGRIAPTIFTPAPAPPVVITITVPTVDPPQPGMIQIIIDTITGVVTTGASAGTGSVGR
jgi:hypothetical protein